MSTQSVSGRLHSAESGLRSATPPQSDDSTWRLPSGVILPPRRYLRQLGALGPNGALKFSPQVVRGGTGPLLVVVGHLSCFFQSKGKKLNGEHCGRWLLTSVVGAKCEQWVIDENGDAYNISEIAQSQLGGVPLS